MVIRIDIQSERIFRQVLYAVIKGSAKAFEKQLDAFTTDDALIAVCARATNVATLVILEQYKGLPTPEQIQELAGHIASFHEGWSGITAASLTTSIQAIFEGRPMEHLLPVGVAVRTPFVLAGHLLLQFHQPTESSFDYLDRLWGVLEQQT